MRIRLKGASPSYIFSRARSIPMRILRGRSTKTTDVDGPIVSRGDLPDLPEMRAELLSILAKHLENKAVTVLNHPKIPETPWRVYDLAVRLDYEMVKRQGHAVPIHLSDGVKKYIIKLDIETQRERRRVYAMLRDKEKLMDEITLLKLEKRQKIHDEFARRVREERPEFDVGRGFRTDSGRHLLGPRLILDRGLRVESVNQIASGNLLFAQTFGQNFVIDLALPYAMEAKEVWSLHSQMKEVYNVNKMLWEPFNIHLCGYDADNLVMKNMVSSFDNFMWRVTPDCFTRIFPRERLVYLSPDSPNVLTHYSHDDIYILGALIDKRIPKKYSYSKAQRLGIRSARFDLGNYLELTRQKLPYLAFSDVFNVMVDARDTDGNWFYSFQNLITGRKRMFRWRDELEASQPVPAAPAPNPLGLPERFNQKYLEKERAMVKLKRIPVSQN